MLAVLALVAASSMNAGPEMRDTALRMPLDAPNITIDALPYARTVSCGSYTVTGEYVSSAPTGWTAAPSGDSGVCTDLGAGLFSCVVTVAPDAVGDGVEVITVGDARVTIGFYVAGSHSCFLAQNVNGSYNAGIADDDAVPTWENVGTSGLDVTQGVGTAQPKVKLNIVGGQPVVRCDGGDSLAAAAAADWTYLSNGTDWSFDSVAYSVANPADIHTIAATTTAVNAIANRGWSAFLDDRVSVPANDRLRWSVSSGAALNLSFISNDNQWPTGVFHLTIISLDDDGGAGGDGETFVDGTTLTAALRTGAYSASAPEGPLTLCAETDGGRPLTGDIFRALFYQSRLTSTQRGINKTVDEWALGGALPVTP